MIEISKDLIEYARMAEDVDKKLATRTQTQEALAMASLNHASMNTIFRSKKPYYADLYGVLYERVIESAKQRKMSGGQL